MRRIIYISGPISSPEACRMLENIHRFAVVENLLIKHGFAPINPASDSAAVGLGGLDFEMLMEKDEALVKMSDALFMLPGWDDSAGASTEHRWAIRGGIPTFDNLNDLNIWLHESLLSGSYRGGSDA